MPPSPMPLSRNCAGICLTAIFLTAALLLTAIVYRRRHAQRHVDSTYKLPGGVVMCWAILAFFAFVIWTLCTKHETAIALAWFPLGFVFLAGGWLIVRRRPGRAERYRQFLTEMNQPTEKNSAT